MSKETVNIPLENVADDNLAPIEVSELDLYQRREKIYTRKIEGFFQRIRLLSGWPLLLGYFLLPWLHWADQQAVLFDLPERKFHIFFLTFWPQDFPLLSGLLIICAFGLFAITNFAGRIWCGYTCPQTVWTAIYMWAEQFSEGSRNQRIKLDQEPWSLKKAFKKALKHTLWLGFAFLTGFTFIAYFYPSYELFIDLFRGQLSLSVYAWIVFFTAATYINAGWMREQVCMYMCPYARFQSVMFDADTLIVSYDYNRGEPRGSRRRDNSNPEKQTLGDCIDCQICVQVCPTGIDIRNGLQYECIGCALCIDGCNSVMDKMGYAPGLIRYTTEHLLEGAKTKILRPRLIGYFLVLTLMILAFIFSLINRPLLQLDVIRDRQQIYSVSSAGLIENIYRIEMLNKTSESQWFNLHLEGLQGVKFTEEPRYWIEAGTLLEMPIRLISEPQNLKKTINTVEFRLASEQGASIEAKQASRFIGPDDTQKRQR